MLIVFNTDDIIDLKIHDVIIKFRVLDFQERMEISTRDSLKEGSYIEDSHYRVMKTLQKAVRGIEGAYLPDGSPFKLEFLENGDVSPKSITALFNSSYGAEIVHAALAYLTGQNLGPVTHKGTNEVVPGVEFVLPSKKKQVKKKAKKASSSRKQAQL